MNFIDQVKCSVLTLKVKATIVQIFTVHSFAVFGSNK